MWLLARLHTHWLLLRQASSLLLQPASFVLSTNLVSEREDIADIGSNEVTGSNGSILIHNPLAP
jgi:hypothetical protein